MSGCHEENLKSERLCLLKIIHRDIAARNFLVNEHGRVLLCDFGLSRRLPPSAEYEEKSGGVYYQSSGGNVPWRSCAPESLRDLKFSLKSDVWMYGESKNESVQPSY